ncbi:MAG: SDR family NAD(P)-dependent oxidoreductase [Chloroflexi bacterium]|nr:SDR family NAD(P)-dependent oxidoreductase [Chloroflexota bacterium]MDL1884686.1 glucose 1-dehydrogenase [Anaerolineae bacterium CFX8]GIL11521.1 MAG: short-chain dehydrogenase [Chloroflexota bacterium]
MNKGFDLSGKVAIITGASRGIGQAIAESYAAAGAKVVLSSRKQEGLDAAAEQIRANGGEALALAAHNGDKTALQGLVRQTVEAYGRVDILVNNAATNPHFGPLLEAEDSMWQKTIEVNIMGAVWLTQAVVPHMRRSGGGKIVNVASVNGIRPGRLQGIYSMTKAAIINLTQTLAMELGIDHIQVNAIAPGLVRTRFARALWESDELQRQFKERAPAGRIGEPEDIAGIALYLASPASDYTTGQVFVVDGGMLIPNI